MECGTLDLNESLRPGKQLSLSISSLRYKSHMIISIVTSTLREAFMVLPIRQCEGVILLLILSLTKRESDRELDPSVMTIHGCHASSVNTDDRLNECKSKSVPPRRASFDSSLEEVTTNLRIEARAVAFHNKRSHVSGVSHPGG